MDPIELQVVSITELDDGNIYRKPRCLLMVKTPMDFRLRFSLKASNKNGQEVTTTEAELKKAQEVLQWKDGVMCSFFF